MPKTKIKAKSAPELGLAFLKSAPELSIFLACADAVDRLRALAAEYESGELARIAFSRRSTVVVAELCELASATERFDIVCPVAEFGRFSPFFWRWFNWWQDSIKDLTPRQLDELVHLAGQGCLDANAGRPREDWVMYRQTPAFALIIT